MTCLDLDNERLWRRETMVKAFCASCSTLFFEERILVNPFSIPVHPLLMPEPYTRLWNMEFPVRKTEYLDDIYCYDSIYS